MSRNILMTECRIQTVRNILKTECCHVPVLPPGGAAEPTGAPGLPVSYRGGPTTTECSRQPLHPTHPNHRMDPQGTDARREVPKGSEARRGLGAEAR